MCIRDRIQTILLSFEVEARIVQRKKYQVVYMKDGTGISDFLNIVEANKSLMNFENYRIVKEMRNSVNRRVNCETANIGKTVNASTRQAEDILLLQEKYGFENLPDGLKEMAEIRLAYPDAPLRELSLIHICKNAESRPAPLSGSALPPPPASAVLPLLLLKKTYPALPAQASLRNLFYIPVADG